MTQTEQCYTDHGKRHEFVLLFDVTNGNPNGDPDAGNLPRVDPETGHGLVSDVCLKRKVRDYVARTKDDQPPFRIFIQSQVALNSLILQAFRHPDVGVEPPQVKLKEEDEDVIEWLETNAPEGFDIDEDGNLVYAGEAMREREITTALTAGLEEDNETKALRDKLRNYAKEVVKAAKGRKIDTPKRAKAQGLMAQEYYDIRMFGAVLQTGLNAGQVRGPMQLTFARSADRIFTMDTTVTRQARTTTARMQTGSTEMGRKPMVPYGLYRAHGFFSPFFAAKTNVTPDDLELFWTALANAFEEDHSASRGEMICRGLYVFSHENPLGNAPAHRLFERVIIRRTPESLASNLPARSYRDYEVSVIEQPAIPEGVTVTKLYNDWND